MSNDSSNTDSGESDDKGKQQGLNAAAEEADSEQAADTADAETDESESASEETADNAGGNTETDGSSDDNGDGIPILDELGGGDVGRKVAKRVFAREISDATFQFRESDEDRSPRYTLLPTGEKANRVFIVGTITEIEDVGTDGEYLRARIVDPTGTTYAYAGEYQQDAAAFLQQAEPPLYVAVTAKFKKVYETDNGDKRVSIAPETIHEVDEKTRDSWVAETAQQTLERIQTFDSDSTYGQLVEEQYNSNAGNYTDCVVDAGHDLSPRSEDDNEAKAEAD